MFHRICRACGYKEPTNPERCYKCKAGEWDLELGSMALVVCTCTSHSDDLCVMHPIN